jgi:hypothetical protein
MDPRIVRKPFLSKFPNETRGLVIQNGRFLLESLEESVHNNQNVDIGHNCALSISHESQALKFRSGRIWMRKEVASIHFLVSTFLFARQSGRYQSHSLDYGTILFHHRIQYYATIIATLLATRDRNTRRFQTLQPATLGLDIE